LGPEISLLAPGSPAINKYLANGGLSSGDI